MAGVTLEATVVKANKITAQLRVSAQDGTNIGEVRRNDFSKKKIFEDKSPFLWGHRYPCFGLLMMSALGLKTIVDPLACVLF